MRRRRWGATGAIDEASTVIEVAVVDTMGAAERDESPSEPPSVGGGGLETDPPDEAF